MDFRADNGIEKVAHLISNLYADRDMIAAALSYSNGTHTFDDVAMMILKGQLIYWHLDNSCIVGELQNYPQKKNLHFFLSAGNLNEITAMQEQMVDTAKALGCVSMSITGRPGWKKPLGDLGWFVSSTTMSFDVENSTPVNPIAETKDVSVDGPIIDKETEDGRRRKGRLGGDRDQVATGDRASG
jgi:hypothetical protein